MSQVHTETRLLGVVVAHKMLKSFAKMGKAAGLTRDELVVKLTTFGTPEEVRLVVDEVMATPMGNIVNSMCKMRVALDAAKLSEKTGVAVDNQGFDEADRMTESIILAALDDDAEDHLN